MIPVVDYEGRLIGEYLEWDDVLWLEWYFSEMSDKRNAGLAVKYLNHYENVLFLRPHTCCEYSLECQDVDCLPCNSEKKCADRYFFMFQEFLCTAIANVNVIEDMSFFDANRYENAIFLTPDEEAKRVMRIQLTESKEKYNIISYREFMERTYEICFVDNILSKISFMLGVNPRFTDSKYSQRFREKAKIKFDKEGLPVGVILPESAEKDFYCELYEESYIDAMRDATTVSAKPGKLKPAEDGLWLRDIESKYVNVRNGERVTLGQPEIYERTIWLVGPCYFVGARVEDAHTIASYLQEKINNNGFHVRVKNLGFLGSGTKLKSELQKIAAVNPTEKDIIVMGVEHTDALMVSGLLPVLNFVDVLEQHGVTEKWVVNDPSHVNHRVYKLYADAIYDAILPALETPVEHDDGTYDTTNTGTCEGENTQKNNDAIRELYLDRYFHDYHSAGTVGAIVMNCNPFTFGHRYLIEQALAMVDNLIIFVVEEDKSVYTFNERLKMVWGGYQTCVM